MAFVCPGTFFDWHLACVTAFWVPAILALAFVYMSCRLHLFDVRLSWHVHVRSAGGFLSADM
jgi:hypothetical protein